MSDTPISSSEKDPTIVVKMLESLTRKTHRVGSNLGYGFEMPNTSTDSDTFGGPIRNLRRRGAKVATRLTFDESLNIERPQDFSNRKRFIQSNDDDSSYGIASSSEKQMKYTSSRKRSTQSYEVKLSLGVTSSTEKQIKSENTSSSDVLDSPWEYRLMKADLLSAKSQIEVLENRNQQLHALRREHELVLENEKASLKLENDRHIDRIKDLETRMDTLKRRWYECKEELEEVKGRLNSFNNDSNIKTHTLENKIADLKEQIRESELTAHKNMVAAKQRESLLEIQLATAAEMAELQKKQVSELTTKLQEAGVDHAQVEKLKLELQDIKLKVKSLESEKEDMKEAEALALSQKQKLLKFPEMEMELAKLKDDNVRLHGLVQNKLFLEEKVSNLELKLASSEDRDKEYAHLQARVSCLEISNDEWMTLTKDLGGLVCSPSSLRLQFEYLQKKELQLTAELAELKSRLKGTAESKTLLSTELESLKTQFEKQKVTNEQQANFLLRQRKKLTLVSQERDYYRSQLDSYEKDLTISTHTPPTSQQEQNRSRIALLEKTLQGYHELVEKLENDNTKEKKVGVPTESPEKERNLALETERDGLKKENLELKQKLDELELELQFRALKGDYNPTKTKVLHFKNNPRAEAEGNRQDELFALRAECEKLQERVRVLQDGMSSKDVTLIVEENVKATHSKEVQSLQDEVSSYKMKNQRLKEAFKKTSNEFREIVYQVLGYRIDWKNTNEYHLSSMYAENQDDILVFQYNSESGAVNMLETSFSNTLTSLIDLHLRRQKSIPVFLSAVTLDLFSQQTMSTVTESITLA